MHRSNNQRINVPSERMSETLILDYRLLSLYLTFNVQLNAGSDRGTCNRYLGLNLMALDRHPRWRPPDIQDRVPDIQDGVPLASMMASPWHP